jgi:hypothetical protein
MKSHYFVSPFFFWSQPADEEKGKKARSGYCTIIQPRTKKGKGNGERKCRVVRILTDNNSKDITDKDRLGGRDRVVALCEKVGENFSDDLKTKYERYAFISVLPEEAQFTWDGQHKEWSQVVRIGGRTIVLKPRNDSKGLPSDGADCAVSWKVRPSRVLHRSPDGNFVLVMVSLLEETTSGRAIRRQIQNGHREEYKPSEGAKKPRPHPEPICRFG